MSSPSAFVDRKSFVAKYEGVSGESTSWNRDYLPSYRSRFLETLKSLKKAIGLP